MVKISAENTGAAPLFEGSMDVASLWSGFRCIYLDPSFTSLAAK